MILLPFARERKTFGCCGNQTRDVSVTSKQARYPLHHALSNRDGLKELVEIEKLTGWKRENEFQIEGVELRQEEDEDDGQDGQPALQRRQRVPGELDPSVRTESCSKVMNRI